MPSSPAGPEASVLIPTYRRPAQLARTLASLERGAASEAFDVVVIDNADDAETREVCRSQTALHVTYLVETVPGKNAALNRGCRDAAGALLLFTDDDVIAAADWISHMLTAARRWPDHAIFGGRVLPQWPPESTAPRVGPRYLGPCYTVLAPDCDPGPCPGFRPFGPNLAIRRTLFDGGLRFDTAVGPRRGSYVMGSETEMIGRLARSGHIPVYVPESVVHHVIRPHQLTTRWLVRRAFRYGRQLGYQSARQTAAGTRGLPLWRLRSAGQRAVQLVFGAHSGRDFLERALDLSVELGALYEVARPRRDRSVETAS